MPVRQALCFLLVLWSGAAQAVDWYTVTGDKANADVDTTQIDATTIDRRVGVLGLRFRVTLAKARTLPGGEVYQSYVSHIAVDCPTGAIFHEDQTRYEEALWTGKSRFEKFVQPKPMAFALLVPDPRPKILAAACESRPSSRRN